MSAVEIEAAISELAFQSFDAVESPFAFLAAFGNKDTTLKRLRTGNNNASDVPGGVLQRNSIHIAVCRPDSTSGTWAKPSMRCAPARPPQKRRRSSSSPPTGRLLRLKSWPVVKPSPAPFDEAV